MRSKLAALLCLMMFLSALAIGCSSAQEGTIDVPIKIVTDREVSAVAFELIYDPAVLEATSVGKSTLAQGSSASYTVVDFGRLYVQVTNATNIDRDGTLVVAHFKVLDYAGSSTLSIDLKGAEDANTHQALPFRVSDGRFDAADMSIKPVVITIG